MVKNRTDITTKIRLSTDKQKNKRSYRQAITKKPNNTILSILPAIGKPSFLIIIGLIYLLTYSLKIFTFLISSVSFVSSYPFIYLSKKARKIGNSIEKFISLWPKISARKKIVGATEKKHPLSIIWQSFLNLGRFRKLFAPVALLAGVALFICLSYPVWTDLPNPDKLISRSPATTTKIYDRNGKLLYKIYRQQNRTLVGLDEIPQSLINATIAIEDAEFYQHHGLSLKGIFRAAKANITEGKTEGGSTITQQLVKNTLLTPERTYTRKIKEILVSLLVERKFSKRQILQMYLNEVGYGGAVYGVEEASQTYFGKKAKDLNLAESALLAGLPVSPTSYSPFGVQPELAKERQGQVLDRMVEEKFITRDQAEEAYGQELEYVLPNQTIEAPHFVMYVKDLLVKKYGERIVEEGGLEVITTLDLDLQHQAEKIVKEEVDKLKGLNITNGSALVTNPKTGEILAMVGSKSYFDKNIDGNVNVTIRPRQPGSTIKVVNYALALQNGYSPSTIINDSPVSFVISGQPAYSPKNYDNRFHGNITLRTALASSYNVPAVKVLASLGVEKMVELGQIMGITSWDNPSRFGLSLTLGGGETKMTELATVYGVLANQGIRVDLNPLLSVKNQQDDDLLKSATPALRSKNLVSESSEKRVLPAVVAFQLTDILSDNRARTPAFGPNSLLNIPNHPSIAVKTGTTTNMRDNWTIGYSPNLLVAVWVGNNDNSPMSHVASGITGASPIWNKIMTYAIKGVADQPFPVPDVLTKVKVCSLTNTLPCEGCPTTEEWFVKGTEPKTHCAQEEIEEKKQKIN